MLVGYKALQIGLILAGGLCISQQTMALGLGELVVGSTLSEPLDANIELLDVTGLQPAQISITLGSQEDFARAGVELSALASQVQFSVEVNGDAGSIHLTTLNSVDEPFLDLVLNVSWPDGAVQQDYTVLLDLPGKATATGPLVIPGAGNSSPPTTTADANFSQGNDGAVPGSDGQSYSVVNGDSMWEIAAQTRPSSAVSVHQMMLAIQRANEDAFINNNINRVLSGKVLRIPTLQEINLIDQDAAIAQVSQQNQDLGLQPLAVNRTADDNNTTPQQDELTVLTNDQSSSGAAGNSDLEATIASLETEMMLSEESLDRARLENAELSSRFKMLEEEMDLLQNLISMEDARIAQLQANLSTQAETVDQALATTEDAANVLAAQQPGVMGSVSGWLQNTAVLMGVILALLLIVLGYLFWQRRRMEAAVYAFDSGIPELETPENSSFAPAAKTGGGIMGWLSGLGSKDINKDRDLDLVAYSERAVAAGGVNLRDATTSTSDTRANVDQNRVVADSGYLDEEQANQSIQGGAGTVAAKSASITRTITTTEFDDAELADALISEAKGIANNTDVADDYIVDELTDDEKEAQALAELVTPDARVAVSAVPEPFEFTVKTTPEVLAEKANVEAVDYTESFDFQLSESGTTEGNVAAEHEMTDEELQLSALQLDEEEGDYQTGTPMDECDTKLDLAVAYEAMGDIDGAVEILGEVIADGDSAQIAEANRLKGLWQNS